MGTPTRLTQGLSTQVKGSVLGDYPLPDPFHTGSTNGLDVFTYSNDFVDLGNAASRTITGSATFALADGLGGIGVLTPSGATVAASVYRTAAAFQFIAGQRFWFVHRIKASSVAGNVVLSFGVSKSTAGTIATTDRLAFTKAAGSTSLNLVSTVGSTATTLVTGVATAVSDTYLDVGFYYDGTDLLVFANDALVARVANPTIGSSGTTLTNATLTPFFAITPVATETVTVDYALIAQEVSR